MPLHSAILERAAQFIKGEDAYLDQPVPPQLGNLHITQLLRRHPFYPYDPAIQEKGPGGHPCWALNEAFFKCMDGLTGVPLFEGEPEEMPLHMKHVTCYHPHKVELMKCLTRFKKEQKQLAAAQEPGKV